MEYIFFAVVVIAAGAGAVYGVIQGKELRSREVQMRELNKKLSNIR